MFKTEKESKDRTVRLYFLWLRIQKIVVSVALFLNLVFVLNMATYRSYASIVMFVLNLYSSAVAYWYVTRKLPKKRKKEKEKNPIVG